LSFDHTAFDPGRSRGRRAGFATSTRAARHASANVGKCSRRLRSTCPSCVAINRGDTAPPCCSASSRSRATTSDRLSRGCRCIVARAAYAIARRRRADLAHSARIVTRRRSRRSVDPRQRSTLPAGCSMRLLAEQKVARCCDRDVRDTARASSSCRRSPPPMCPCRRSSAPPRPQTWSYDVAIDGSCAISCKPVSANDPRYFPPPLPAGDPQISITSQPLGRTTESIERAQTQRGPIGLKMHP
jgi:hypothetical protein